MAKPARNRAMRNLNSAANYTARITGRTAEKAAVGLFRWATTGHTGLGDALARMPPMGFWDTIKHA